MELSSDKKRITILAVGVLVILAGTALALLRPQSLLPGRSPQQQVDAIAEHGFDTSKSLFTPDETTKLKGDLDGRINAFVHGQDPSVENLIQAARLARDLHDFDQSLALFAVVDSMNPTDLFYKIDVGQIHLERQEWEAARQVFEPMKITWPVHEAYLGLAEAYKHIEGTPNYVVDQIYDESVFRNRSEYAVLEAYADWLEKSGREEKAIPYLEEMYRQGPNEFLKQKIDGLKAKYNK